MLNPAGGSRRSSLNSRLPSEQREAEPSLRDEILTTEEVCTLLMIKEATFYRHASQGPRPRFYKIGKHNRWRRGSTRTSMS
jgi:predicted DNA-binding transcriptional regulator AlpA